MRNAHIILVEIRQLDEKIPVGRHKRRWEDNIKMDMRIWTAFIWLRIETGGGFLRARQ
jgi:hypothetical protein